jgi:enamine deaminase RidA (YjgF/YER057c/UK114 family)
LNRTCELKKQKGMIVADKEESQTTRSRQAGWPFPDVRRVGTTVYVGLQIGADKGVPSPSASASGEIEPQTHHVFAALESRLNEAGATMSQLTKLHTYYLFSGDGRAVTDYWERMTAARLDHLSNPSAAATALRVPAVLPGRSLIGADGIAEMTADKTRIMPKHAWDWSIPTPFSQGWRAGNIIYVGGQISSDRKGRTIAPDDVAAQTHTTLDYIRHVLLDAATDWSNVVSIKIAYKCTQDAAASRAVGNQIVHEVAQVFPDRKPALITLGVDLLYEGLMLEIDAVAVTGETRAIEQTPADAMTNTVPDADTDTAVRKRAPVRMNDFPAAWVAGDQVYIGAHYAAGYATLSEQLRHTLVRLAATVRSAGAEIGHLVKINVYCCAGPDGAMQENESATVVAMLDAFLEKGRTVVSVVQTAGLLLPGQRVQVDGLVRRDQS